MARFCHIAILGVTVSPFSFGRVTQMLHCRDLAVFASTLRHSGMNGEERSLDQL